MAQSEPLCVYCRRQHMDPACRPFCSERCRMADLGRWLSGDYRVAGGAPDNGPVDMPDANAARPHRDDDDD